MTLLPPDGRWCASLFGGTDPVMIGCTQETPPFVLDLTGGTPLFPVHELRNGYLRVDPHRRRPSATPATRTARHWRCLPALGSS
ncbi:MAG TPA: hypothetical protein VIS03_04590 [Kiloniellaceae bacterium]